jgi:hypothetical protein
MGIEGLSMMTCVRTNRSRRDSGSVTMVSQIIRTRTVSRNIRQALMIAAMLSDEAAISLASMVAEMISTREIVPSTPDAVTRVGGMASGKAPLRSIGATRQMMRVTRQTICSTIGTG